MPPTQPSPRALAQLRAVTVDHFARTYSTRDAEGGPLDHPAAVAQVHADLAAGHLYLSVAPPDALAWDELTDGQRQVYYDLIAEARARTQKGGQ